METRSTLIDALNAQKAEVSDIALLLQKLAPGIDPKRKALEKPTPLALAFDKLDRLTQREVFQAAMNAAQMGRLLHELINNGTFQPSDVDGLRNGTLALRTVDYHVPGGGVEVNEWLECRMRYVSLKMATMDWYLLAARLEERHPDHDAASVARLRALAEESAQGIDHAVAMVEDDIAMFRQQVKDQKAKL
jgi:hypothetical protein